MRRLLILLLLLAGNAEAQNWRQTVLRTSIYYGVGGSVTTFTINGATDELQSIYCAQEDETITEIRFRYGARTGTPVAHKVGIQGVDATDGEADGTYLTGTGECSGSFTPPADGTWDNTWREITLTGTTCAIAAGTCYAVVIEPTGTPDGSNNSSFAAYWSNAFNDTTYNYHANNEYAVTVDAGTPTKTSNSPMVLMGNATTNRWFGYPIDANSFGNYSSDSTPDEKALRFQIECNGTYQIAGGQWCGNTPSAGKTVALRLYSGTTQLKTVTLDTDQLRNNGATRMIRMYFDPETLTCGNTYRLAVTPLETATNVGLLVNEVDVNEDFDSWPLGIQAYYSSRTDAGSWTDDDNLRPCIEPIIYQMDTSGGGGGGIIGLNDTQGGSQ